MRFDFPFFPALMLLLVASTTAIAPALAEDAPYVDGQVFFEAEPVLLCSTPESALRAAKGLDQGVGQDTVLSVSGAECARTPNLTYVPVSALDTLSARRTVLITRKLDANGKRLEQTHYLITTRTYCPAQLCAIKTDYSAETDYAVGEVKIKDPIVMCAQEAEAIRVAEHLVRNQEVTAKNCSYSEVDHIPVRIIPPAYSRHFGKYILFETEFFVDDDDEDIRNDMIATVYAITERNFRYDPVPE